jgi:hypothetical protein
MSRRRGKRDRDIRLAKAFAHPLRFEIIAIARRRAVSQREFEEGARYHFRELLALGAIKPARGAQPRAEGDRTYRATYRAAFVSRALQGKPWGAAAGALLVFAVIECVRRVLGQMPRGKGDRRRSRRRDRK